MTRQDIIFTSLPVGSILLLGWGIYLQCQPARFEQRSKGACQDVVFELHNGDSVTCAPGSTLEREGSQFVTCRCPRKASETPAPPKPKPAPVQAATPAPAQQPTVIVEQPDQPSLVTPVLVHHGLKLLLGH